MTGNDDDLYGDLDDAAVAKPAPSNAGRTEQYAAAQETSTAAPPPLATQPEIAQLQQQLKSLKAENDVLKKNIGILYRTAKSELERKDRTIDQLQSEIDALRR